MDSPAENSSRPASKLPDAGAIQAILAAALFGLASPLVKPFLVATSPVVVAGLLYIGSGVGLGAWWLLRGKRRGAGRAEAPLERRHAGWLAAAIVFGGIAGPSLQMIGLARTPASTASLLLNLEGVLTAMIAWGVFRENYDRRIALGMGFILAGGAVLTWTGRPEFGVPWGPIAIAGACACWALDNNLTRKVSGGDPIQVAALKGICAGSFTLALGLSTGGRMPGPAAAAACAAIGLGGYGISLVLFVLALRRLGAARTGAYFSLAPFVGAAASMVFLIERPTLGFGAALALMAAGIYLHLTERHEHEHTHEPVEHNHRHLHDEHHLHAHPDPGSDSPHAHRHERLTHIHPHYPDLHHSHSH
ncbi:MAG: EamA family transporter [Planctomycetes bacterium]|nr:EamA family transporter [Planctomycetota bacterium]